MKRSRGLEPLVASRQRDWSSAGAYDPTVIEDSRFLDAWEGPFVFVSERGGPISADMVARIVTEAAEAAVIGFHVHPQMLRHSVGNMLADEGWIRD
jgi:site-specific recombinase XerC